MDNRESAGLGFVGRPTKEQGALIDAAVKEQLDDEAVLNDEREALLRSKPESSKKNDEQDQQKLFKFDEVCGREAAKLDERAVQLQKKAEELYNKEEELHKKAEELNNKEEELKKKDVYRQDEHLRSEMLEGFLKTQESVQNLQTQVGSLAKEFSQIPLSSQSSVAGGMEMATLPRTTTALSPVIVIQISQPATHSHSVVVHGDPQGNRVVCSCATMRPIVVPAYHSTQIIFIPCGQRIQVVPLGAEPLAPAAYPSTGLTTPVWVASSSDASLVTQVQMLQLESGNGCGTSGRTGNGSKGKQHS